MESDSEVAAARASVRTKAGPIEGAMKGWRRTPHLWSIFIWRIISRNWAPRWESIACGWIDDATASPYCR